MTEKAIQGFDHHCLFLQKSIGHGTHHYFLMFMLVQGKSKKFLKFKKKIKKNSKKFQKNFKEKISKKRFQQFVNLNFDSIFSVKSSVVHLQCIHLCLVNFGRNRMDPVSILFDRYSERSFHGHQSTSIYPQKGYSVFSRR